MSYWNDIESENNNKFLLLIFVLFLFIFIMTGCKSAKHYGVVYKSPDGRYITFANKSGRKVPYISSNGGYWSPYYSYNPSISLSFTSLNVLLGDDEDDESPTGSYIESEDVPSDAVIDMPPDSGTVETPVESTADEPSSEGSSDGDSGDSGDGGGGDGGSD